MVVMDQYTRRIIGCGVHAGNVDGQALCRMFSEATSTWANVSPLCGTANWKYSAGATGSHVVLDGD